MFTEFPLAQSEEVLLNLMEPAKVRMNSFDCLQLVDRWNLRWSSPYPANFNFISEFVKKITDFILLTQNKLNPKYVQFF